MPEWLQKLVPFSPTTHFISFAQAILFRGAGLDVVWRDFAALAAIGVVLFTLALARFRRTVTEARCLFRKSLASFLGLPLIWPG
jgi:ABC-2 type transport system permease protein